MCGTPFTSSCVASSDIRYDSAHTNDLIEQDSNWEHFAGLWKVDIKAFDGENNPIAPSPYNPTTGRGDPYNNAVAVGFYNHSFSGSRFKADRIYMLGPAPAEFCAQPLIPPLVNFSETAGGNSICGETGRAVKAGFLGTSTYEKDGTLNAFRYYGGYSAYSDWFDTNSSYYSNIDQSTVIGLVVFEPILSQNNVFFYVDDSYTVAEIQQAMYIMGSPGFRDNYVLATMYKLNEDEWLDAIDEAYDTFKIADADRINPSNSECLVPGSCPTEEVWSNVGRDPNLSESPYQEPPATVKAGPIVGFCVLGFALVLFAIYLLVRHRTKQQEHRFRGHFVRTMCTRISVRQSVGAISPDALAKEFAKIDSVQNNGYIDKDELWAFVQTGKAGEMSEDDFGALFSAMDMQGRGKVSFVEFCTFLSGCGDQFDEAYEEKNTLDKEHLMKNNARRLSRLSQMHLTDSVE